MHKFSRLALIVLALSVLFLTACTGGSNLAASSWPGVTVTESNVYVAFGKQVYALSAASGQEAWRFPEEPENTQTFFAAPAASADGTQLIVAGYDKILYSVDAETGDLAGWTFAGASNRYIADVLVTDDGVFAANGNGSVYALDFAGNELWTDSYDTGEPIWAAPAQDGGILYFASLDHNLHAVDIASGAQVWKRDLGTASTGVPAIVDGVLYTGTFGSRVFALDAATGEEIWTFETVDWVFGSVAASGGVVYAGDVGGILYAIDAISGDEVWRFEAEGGIYGGPLVIGDVVYFGTDTGQFYAVNGGDLVWPYTAAGKIYSPARFTGEYVIIATIEGEALLTALDTDGNSRWTFTPED
jgi:outer membrane protein assembly factor BamB